MNCPNCTSRLNKNQKHAQGVWECKACGGVFHIVVCIQPKEKRIINREKATEIFDKYIASYLQKNPTAYFEDIPQSVFIDAMIEFKSS